MYMCYIYLCVYTYTDTGLYKISNTALIENSRVRKELEKMYNKSSSHSLPYKCFFTYLYTLVYHILNCIFADILHKVISS